MSKTSTLDLEVAVPWNSGHYVPLNGFHPLYRALFDHAPDGIRLNIWDLVRLHRHLQENDAARTTWLEKGAKGIRELRDMAGTLPDEYWRHFQASDYALTTLLLGDVEFHHTALFPSLTRPFVFHCEMFGPVFFPLAHQGTGWFAFSGKVKERYRQVLAHPLCLGIWSHIPETLESFKRFFADPVIDQKLFLSRVGLSAHSVPSRCSEKKPDLSMPRFLFINSAHQQPANFFKQGGHLVLRFWKEFLAHHRDGKLILRCKKPDNQALAERGVDVSFVQRESGNSILWVVEYLTQQEMNELFAYAHFFLVPSFSLHSASILQSLACGAVPVVTDTVGTDVYVKDGETGIVVRGMRDALWFEDPVTGVLLDRYGWTPELEESLVLQMVNRIEAILDDSRRYEPICANAIASSRSDFDGRRFADTFWRQVATVYENARWRKPLASTNGRGQTTKIDDLLLLNGPDQWRRLFESPQQPMSRIHTDTVGVWEIGGRLVQMDKKSAQDIHSFSPLRADEDSVRVAARMEDLHGEYLAGFCRVVESRWLSEKSDSTNVMVQVIARLLRPSPPLYRLASWVLRQGRRLYLSKPVT